MRKKLLFISFLAMIGVIVFTQMAVADYTVKTTGNGGTYSGYGPYQTGQGGEFTLDPNDDLSWVLGNYDSKALLYGGTAFQTFCLEENEYIYGNTVHSATLSNAAIKGGVGGVGSGTADPVSVGTARLYYEFAKGSLANYNYSATTAAEVTARKASAAALQQTIWWLEGELSTLSDSNIFKIYILDKYVTAAAAMADNNGAYPVMALNLWALGHPGELNYLRQDQLVVTPIPGAIWLLGAGLVGLVGIRRRLTN
jgi:hypothetical protein